MVLVEAAALQTDLGEKDSKLSFLLFRPLPYLRLILLLLLLPLPLLANLLLSRQYYYVLGAPEPDYRTNQ